MRTASTWTLACCLAFGSSDAFTFQAKGTHQHCPISLQNTRSLRLLFARKSSVQARGFGGAATEACACGSGHPYNKCCGRLHQDPAAYAAAAAEQVARARYSAYSKRVVDFIMASTHADNKSFADDMEHWKKTIQNDCYDNFELKKCEILSENESADTATVRFLAHMTQRDNRERTAFIEASTFKRHPISGAWLYLDGVVSDPVVDEMQERRCKAKK
jgi:SEC-C motif domain protein